MTEKIALNVEIDETIYRESKKNAVDLNVTLKEYVELALNTKNKEVRKK